MRLVQEPPQGWRPFKRQDFLPPQNAAIDNTCGDSHGCSVDRADHLSKLDIQSRSDNLAAIAQAAAEARKANQMIQRKGGGALVAKVANLRKLRSVGTKERQIVFIYPDPRKDNTEHSIIRLSTSVAEEEVSGVIDDIAAAFN